MLGVAIEDDIYKDARQQIEQELAHREAVEAAARILDEILDGVRTPERARSPVDAYITVRRKPNRWFSRYVIAAMLVDGKQKIAH